MTTLAKSFLCARAFHTCTHTHSQNQKLLVMTDPFAVAVRRVGLNVTSSVVERTGTQGTFIQRNGM